MTRKSRLIRRGWDNEKIERRLLDDRKLFNELDGRHKYDFRIRTTMPIEKLVKIIMDEANRSQ